MNHAEESSELWDSHLPDELIGRVVQVIVLQGAVVDHLVNLVDELELVGLKGITSEDLDDVVLAHKFNDFSRH